MRCYRAAVAGLSLAVIACNRGSGSGEVTPSIAPPVERSHTRAEIQPGNDPPKHAKRNESNLEIPVEVATERHESELTIKLLRHGDLYDSETYVDAPDRFQLVYAANETFNPPIDLLRFPFVPGHTIEWQGQISFGDEPLDARAKVVSSMTQATLGGVLTDVIRVDVSLAHTLSDHRQHMIFTFVPGEGLQKCEFGTTSREPEGAP